MNPPFVCVKIANCLQCKVSSVCKAESKMSKIVSAIYIITRLKRSFANANEGAGACHVEITQIIPSWSRESFVQCHLNGTKCQGLRHKLFKLQPAQLGRQGTGPHAGVIPSLSEAPGAPSVGASMGPLLHGGALVPSACT